jgi:glycosyltransferase involved in cell wall biosynthesis
LGKPIVQFDLTEGRFSAQDASLYAKKNDPVDLADMISGLLHDKERREQMSVFGRKRVEDVLEWKYEVPRLLSAYERLWPCKEESEIAEELLSSSSGLKKHSA